MLALQEDDEVFVRQVDRGRVLVLGVDREGVLVLGVDREGVFRREVKRVRR